MVIWPAKSEVFGRCPIATNTPAQGMSVVLPVTRFFEADTGDHIIAKNVFDDGVPYERDLLVLHRAVLHDFGSSQPSRRWTIETLVANLVRKVASSIALSPPPTSRSVPFLEEEPGAGRAGSTPCPVRRASFFTPDLNGRRAVGGDDDGLRVDCLFSVNGDRERLLRNVYGCDLAGQKLRTEPFCLGSHFLHELRTHDALGKARVDPDAPAEAQLTPPKAPPPKKWYDDLVIASWFQRPEEKDAGRGPLFKRVETGPRLLDRLTSPPMNIREAEALKRLQGLFVGPDNKQSCAVVTLTEEGKRDLRVTLNRFDNVTAERAGPAARRGFAWAARRSTTWPSAPKAKRP